MLGLLAFGKERHGSASFCMLSNHLVRDIRVNSTRSLTNVDKYTNVCWGLVMSWSINMHQ